MKRKSHHDVSLQHHKDRNMLVQTIVSVVSTLLVLFTLFEMQAERNAAYRPSLSIGNTEIAFVWDSEKALVNPDEISEDISRFIDGTTTINRTPKIDIYNIGVGTAKAVEFEWNNEENIDQLIQALEKYCDIHITIDNNGLLSMEKDTRKITTGLPAKTTFEFVSNSTENTYSIVFPDLYYYFMAQLCSHVPLSELDIHFSLIISYCDIQGKSYSENIILTPKQYFSTYSEDNSGFGIYTLFSEESKTMEYLNIDNDTLIAITSVFAVVISIISIVFTTIFSILQIKHNKNSVRPISSIQVSDYENLLAVNISNVGTGPLTITKLRASNKNVEVPALIELMPDIEQDWSTFIESADGWTLPVGGKITLIEIEPENDMIKNAIRCSLSKITVSLEYTDIYNTKFHDERKLDFFGRHYIDE